MYHNLSLICQVITSHVKHVSIAMDIDWQCTYPECAGRQKITCIIFYVPLTKIYMCSCYFWLKIQHTCIYNSSQNILNSASLKMSLLNISHFQQSKKIPEISETYGASKVGLSWLKYASNLMPHLLIGSLTTLSTESSHDTN